MADPIILTLVKDELGLRSDVRDTYISAIIDGVVAELKEEQGLVLDGANPYHYMFIVDYSAWRYRNKSNETKVSMPRDLQYRLHNLIIKLGG